MFKSEGTDLDDHCQSRILRYSSERTEHPAQYPEELIERIIKTGTKPGDLVLDPFMGSGTTAVCAQNLDRNFVGYETEEDFITIAKQRLNNGKK